MTSNKTLLMLGLILTATIVTATLTLRAQERVRPKTVVEERQREPVSIQDALLRPFDFTFNKPTAIEDVAAQLGKALNCRVVLDRAAFDRQELKTDDDVQLQLEGVRLKTGLKLLLDQLDLTFKVEPEDNLLVITDDVGAESPVEAILADLKALHKDVHAIQDSIEDIREALGVDGDETAKMHKPTIIEELPQEGAPKAKSSPKQPAVTTPPGRSRPGI